MVDIILFLSSSLSGSADSWVCWRLRVAASRPQMNLLFRWFQNCSHSNEIQSIRVTRGLPKSQFHASDCLGYHHSRTVITLEQQVIKVQRSTTVARTLFRRLTMTASHSQLPICCFSLTTELILRLKDVFYYLDRSFHAVSASNRHLNRSDR